jgi:hypothetical protein
MWYGDIPVRCFKIFWNIFLKLIQFRDPIDCASVHGNIGIVLQGRSKADEVERRREIFVPNGYHVSFRIGTTIVFCS